MDDVRRMEADVRNLNDAALQAIDDPSLAGRCKNITQTDDGRLHICFDDAGHERLEGFAGRHHNLSFSVSWK